jgi:tetratricopeptide (TPR) repeat protein
LGGALEAAGKDDLALEEYRTVVAEVPDSPHSSDQIDAIYQRRNDSTARVAEWKSLAQNHTDAAVPQLHLGIALEDLGDNTGAEAAYREALRLCPKMAGPKMRLGAVLASGGDVDGGLKLVDEGVKAMPDLAGPAAEACGRAAKRRLSVPDTRGALALLRRARSLSPTDLRYRVALGGALEAAGKDDLALEEYRAVVAEVPDSPHSSDQIDAIYQRRNDPASRVAEWRHTVEFHPDAAVPRIHLGLALEAAGDILGAETAYREALKRDAAVNADSALFLRTKNAARSE